MKRTCHMLLALVLPILAMMFSNSAAEACAGVGHIKMTVMLDGNGNGKGLISEYDCGMMVPKTHCVLGIRLADAASPDIKIDVRQARFVELRDNSALYQGFSPEPNKESTKAWERVMDGTWYGFSAVFRGAGSGRDSNLAIELTFSYDPKAGEQQILRAFEKGHVGLAEGDLRGGIAHGHMLEVLQIQKVTQS
jgi:hypothetical protein